MKYHLLYSSQVNTSAAVSTLNVLRGPITPDLAAPDRLDSVRWPEARAIHLGVMVLNRYPKIISLNLIELFSQVFSHKN